MSETIEVTVNMWGGELLKPPAELSSYQAELDQRYPGNEGYYTVIGVNPQNSSMSALQDKSGYGQYIPSGWLVGTHSSKDGAVIVAMHNPARQYVKA